MMTMHAYAVTARAPVWKRRALALLALGILPLGGCMVGPDFKRPAPPEVAAYTSGASDDAAGTEQRVALGQSISAE